MSPKVCQILLDHGNEILLLVDLSTLEIISVNAAATRHLGYSRCELIGRPITDIECSLTDVFFWEDVKQGIAPEVHDSETSYLRADGKQLTATKTISRPATHPGWAVICAVPTGRLRRTEDELADTGARLRATLEATADGILLVDRSGSIVNMNHRFSQLWQIPDEILLAHDDAALLDFLASGHGSDPAGWRRRDPRYPHPFQRPYSRTQIAPGAPGQADHRPRILLHRHHRAKGRGVPSETGGKRVLACP